MISLNQFIFGIFPYIALCVFFLGSLFRYEGKQYSWKSESTQVLYQGWLRLGNIMFHVGILLLFFGHMFGLLTPLWFWELIGVTHTQKQVFAMTMGGIAGSLVFIGLIILIIRRLRSDRLSANTTWRDKLVLAWLLITVTLGLSTLFVSANHLDGEEMVKLMTWAQYIVTFNGAAASYIADTDALFRIHVFMGMCLFVIFPFTRLVHIWSGFASVAYIIRPWQLVRRR